MVWHRVEKVVASSLMLALALAASFPVSARAQGTGRSMDIDLSIRSAGMGGASNALSWGDLNHWANPALLGSAHGVRYVHTHSRLVPGLASNVILTSNAVQAGGGGVGVVFSGKPVDPGGVRLDYGASEGRDENGNFTGTFSAYETVKSFGAGVSAVRAIESCARLLHGCDLNLSRYADISVGANVKRVTIALAPSSYFGIGRTTARDWGLHARVTPYDGFHSEHSPPVRIDLAYGVSVLSYNDDAMVVFINEDQASPVTRHHRRGGAGRIAVGRLPVPPGQAGGRLRRVFMAGLAPLVSLTGASDHADLGGGSVINYHTDGSGLELSIANVFSYRRGHYEDRVGHIADDTWGWGVGLPLGSLGCVRYDDAHIPQAMDSGLGRVHRSQVTVWIDPIAVWRTFKTHE